MQLKTTTESSIDNLLALQLQFSILFIFLFIFVFFLLFIVGRRNGKTVMLVDNIGNDTEDEAMDIDEPASKRTKQ